MSEVWLRLGIVAGLLLISVVVIVWLRRRPAESVAVDEGGLGPGVYLFTSSTCADCAGARRRLQDALGASGFVEIEWEQEPGLFAGLGIDAVPCTVLVADDGSASKYPGMPDRALEGLNP
jgi:hypothetical protein